MDLDEKVRTQLCEAQESVCKLKDPPPGIILITVSRPPKKKKKTLSILRMKLKDRMRKAKKKKQKTCLVLMGLGWMTLMILLVQGLPQLSLRIRMESLDQSTHDMPQDNQEINKREDSLLPQRKRTNSVNLMREPLDQSDFESSQDGLKNSSVKVLPEQKLRSRRWKRDAVKILGFEGLEVVLPCPCIGRLPTSLLSWKEENSGRWLGGFISTNNKQYKPEDFPMENEERVSHMLDSDEQDCSIKISGLRIEEAGYYKCSFTVPGPTYQHEFIALSVRERTVPMAKPESIEVKLSPEPKGDDNLRFAKRTVVI